MAPAVSLHGVGKTYAGTSTPAVDGVSFAIEKGEFFSILGPSGCGKTTLLRMIAGFEEPTTGRIELDGKDVTTVPANQRRVNLVFQDYALFPHLTVERNIAFGLKRKHVDRREIERRVGEVVDLVELGGHEGKKPKQLSGGQKQRVALARALINEPDALLLDEPLAALDLRLRENMKEELRKIQREVGVTFVYVTHDQGEALSLSSRIAVMNRGEVVQVGTPQELYHEPSALFVAEFIGQSNILSARVTSADGRSVLDYDCGVTAELPRSDRAPDMQPGEPVRVLIRPEDVILTSPEDDAGLRGAIGRVSDVDYLGSEYHYTVELESSDRIRVAGLKGSAGDRLSVGQPVRVHWNPTSAAVLPTE